MGRAIARSPIAHHIAVIAPPIGNCQLFGTAWASKRVAQRFTRAVERLNAHRARLIEIA